MTLAVGVENLAKHSSDLVVVDQIDFSMRQGEVVGFPGPNGAGKTTT